MKFLFLIFLTLTLLLNSFSTIIICVTFKINQNEIAKTLCVLRKQKNNSCNGNCVLRAELKKQAHNEKKHDNILKEKVETVYTISSISYNVTPITLLEINKNISSYNASKPISVSFAIFHPPTA